MQRCVGRWGANYLARIAMFPLSMVALGVLVYREHAALSPPTTLLCWALAGAGALFFLRQASFRVVADEAGVAVHRLGRRTFFTWDELKNARAQEAHRAAAGEAPRRRFADPRVIVPTGGEPIRLLPWLSGVEELLASFVEHGVVEGSSLAPAAPRARRPRIVEFLMAMMRTRALLSLGIMSLFALLFLGLLAVGELSGKLTGDHRFDALLIAAGIPLSFGGGAALAHLLRRRALGGAKRPSRIKLEDLLIAVVAIAAAGILFIWFVPRLFRPREDPWADWVIVGLGALFVANALHDLGRYARGD